MWGIMENFENHIDLRDIPIQHYVCESSVEKYTHRSYIFVKKGVNVDV